MSCWNVSGALNSAKGGVTNWYKPNGVETAVISQYMRIKD